MKLALILLAGCGARSAAPPAHADLAIRDVRVFDGVRASEHRTVLIDRGRIVAITAGDAAIPSGATIVDGHDGTLLPGLIDAHAHVNLLDDPRVALDFGVTTEIDMMSSPEVSVALARDDASPAHAHVVPAGHAATAPGGHGTEYGMEVPTLTTPAEAERFVAARVADGSHHLKIILETGVEFGGKVPSLDLATVKALVAAAHAHHLLAVAHVGSAADVTEALDAGIDGLVHVPAQTLDAATIARIAAAHVFVAPTLTVLATACGHHEPIERDPALAPMIAPADARQLVKGFPEVLKRMTCDAPAATVRALHAAGVALLAGTDAPNPGTAHGVSVHDELAHLVAAGLSPTEALIAATSAPARAFQLAAGAIQPGAIADVFLVAGDPTRDVTATRAIREVWRAGVRVDLAARRAEVAALVAAAEAARTASADKLGLLADFESGAAPRYGKLVAASDKLQGGKSTASIAIVDRGAGGSAHALEVTGTVVAAKPGEGWAGVSFLPGTPPLQPVNLAATKRIHFWARGDAHPFYVIVVAGTELAFQEFTPGPSWQEVTIDTAKFTVTLDNVTALTWGSVTPGAFTFAVDQISFE